jgi:CSLREA domain-containing protein
LAQSAGAAGATFVVDTLADPATPDPDNCITPEPGECSLREAIQAANIDVDADTITFDPSLSGTIVLGGSLDPLNGSLTVTGPGADTLTIEGNRSAFGFLQNPDFIGTPYAQDFRLEVSGLHLNGLNAPYSDSPLHLGAIAVFTGDLIVRDVTVTDSASQGPSGGSYFVGGPISAGYLIDVANGGGLVDYRAREKH